TGSPSTPSRGATRSGTPASSADSARRSMLASRAVRDLAARSGIDFDEADGHAPKGVAAEWDAYTVASTPLSADSDDEA
ncbi:MAG TPA: hypothetical protein VHM66_08710, partial [Solirubrobacterales bacterium]|nr:hypothetical protein [Solirubrobacterales bacterium]